MTLMERIKNRILKFLGLEHLSDNPNSNRYTFINDEDTIKEQRLNECRIWYVGDSDELQNYYTNRDLSGNAREPIYNRNKPNYFWGIAVQGDERPIKKVHSGIPRAIVDTLSNAIGMPDIDEEKNHDVIKKIIEANDFVRKLTQEARPLTLVEGWGGWKVNFDKNISDYPIFQFYEGKDVDYVVKSGVLIGMIFRDYYKIEGKNYVFLETRRIDNGNSIIEFELYRYDKSNEVTKVPLNTIEELCGLPEEGYCIEGLKKLLAVPCKYFFDVFNKDYGRSIFTGKLDIFDDIDQCLSQASQTDRVSTPVEYYPVDLLERDKNGGTKMPNVYNRQFIEAPSYPDGDGKSTTKIDTSQPQLNFNQYIERYRALIDIALTGVLSPASMGIDVSKKDNAEAQREKEKVTIFTRNNIMDAETKELKDLFAIALMLKEYMDKGSISLTDYDISVKYCEFASPTFESMSTILLPMWSAGAISTEMYVDKLYGDNLSEEEKQKEIAKLEEQRQADNMDLGDFGLDDDKGFADAGSKDQAGDQETIG